MKYLQFQDPPQNDFPKNLNCVQLVQEEKKQQQIELQDQEIYIQVRYVSIDPVMRVWLSGAKTYYPPLSKGDIVHSFGIGRVIQSKNPFFPVGQTVFGNTGFQEYALVDFKRINTLFPVSNNFKEQDLLYLINNGFAAYFGIDICGIKPGQTCVISTAAGATGILACQIAKIKGAKVIGITGSEKKCEFLRNVLKIDVAINYKNPDYFKQLKANCKKGIDSYFDNVGEEQLNNVLRLINNHGRIALCGASSSYNDFKERKGITNLMNAVSRRVLLRGFNFAEFMHRSEEALAFYRKHINTQQILLFNKMYQGLDQYAPAIREVFEGENIGKIIIKMHSGDDQDNKIAQQQQQIIPKL